MSSYCKIPYLIRHKNSKIYWYNQIYFCKIPNFKWRNICKIPNFDWKWQSYFFVLGATGWWPTFLYGDAEEWRAAPEGWGQWPILRLLLRRGRCRLTTACKGCRRDKPQYAAREWLHWSGDRAICHIRTAATGYRIRQIGIVSYDSLIPQHYNLTLFISSWATKSCPGFCHVRIFTYLSVAKRKQAEL